MDGFKNKVYLILPATNELGGAEKRFYGLWQYLVKIGLPIHLVCSETLYDELCKNSDYPQFDNSLKSKYFLPYNLGSGWALANDVKKFKASHNIDSKAIFHFVLEHPIGWQKNRTLFSCVISDLKIFNLKGQIGQLLSGFFATSIDVLDPKLYNSFKKLFFYKKNRISLTSNSFTNPDIYKPSLLKENFLTFCGNFADIKQVIPLVQAIPAINKALVSNGIVDAQYHIIGYGPLSERIDEIIREPEYQGIDVKKYYSSKPQEILSKSRLFFSLQLHNNYPSKSLIEAMACGNMIVATDCGDTRRLAQVDFSELVPEKFSEEELTIAVLKLMIKSEEEQLQMAATARQIIVENYTVEKMGKYYISLYNQMSK